MYYESPNVSDKSVMVTEPQSDPVLFRRTVFVMIGHWVLQGIVCLIAQFVSRPISDSGIFLISVDEFVHLAILATFTGLLLRSRFLFSWAFGFTVLTFGVGCLLGYLASDHRKSFLGPDFLWALTQYLILIEVGICLLVWPLFRWNYEVAKVERTLLDVKNQNDLKFQFSLSYMFYVTFVVALISLLLSTLGIENIKPIDASFFVFVLFCIACLSNIYFLFQVGVSRRKLSIVNVICWGFVLAIDLTRFDLGTVLATMASYVGLNFWIVVSCLLYRWAGWRIVRYAGRYKSVYKMLTRTKSRSVVSEI